MLVIVKQGHYYSVNYINLQLSYTKTKAINAQHSSLLNYFTKHSIIYALYVIFYLLFLRTESILDLGGNTQKGVQLPHWVFSYVTLVPGQYGPQLGVFSVWKSGLTLFCFFQVYVD